MMAREHRLAAVLFGSAVLCLPAVSAMLSGAVEPAAVGIRYGAAIALVWGAIRLVERMVDGYGSGIEETAEPGADAPTHDRRRAGADQRSAASPEDVAATAGDEGGSG